MLGKFVKLHMGCEFYQRAFFLFYAPLPMFPVLYLKLCFCLILDETLRKFLCLKILKLCYC